mmetsp:Transcript_1526/g.1620  ORF Transcript_1526/g.1620 Transcript_1526/m.1620 type:complete len:205 (-) Transcript_1526:94-708(-)
MNSSNNNDDIIISSETSSLRRGAVVPIVPFGEEKAEIAANNTPKQPRKRFMSISATIASATVMVLTYRSPSIVPSIFTTSSLLFGTRTSEEKQQGEICGGYDWANGICGDGLSCFTGGNNNYCVPNGKEWGCCEDGIECGEGLICSDICNCDGSVKTCKSNTNDDDGFNCNHKFVKKGSCNPNTGEPAAANGFMQCPGESPGWF